MIFYFYFSLRKFVYTKYDVIEVNSIALLSMLEVLVVLDYVQKTKKIFQYKIINNCFKTQIILSYTYQYST